MNSTTITADIISDIILYGDDGGRVKATFTWYNVAVAAAFLLIDGNIIKYFQKKKEDNMEK